MAQRLTSQPYHGPGAVALFAAPFAWFVELTVGYLLATAPCFPTDQRLTVPASQWLWTQNALFVLAVVCILIALWAFVRSLRALRGPGNTLHSVTAAGSRSRFAALWGAAFGGGFFVATLLTGVGLILLPRCGG